MLSSSINDGTQQMKIHFAYAIPRFQSSYLKRGFSKYLILSGRVPTLPILYRRGWLPFLPNPLRAPYSITVNLFRYLKERATTYLYDWEEQRTVKIGDGGIILGHPHPNPNTIVQQAFNNGIAFKRKILIFPIHHAIESIGRFTLPLIEKADIVFGIMGQYWYETLDNSMYSCWKEKIIPLDMAIDAKQYPVVKKRFNKPGKRGYLYIGGNRPEKGCHILNETMAGLGNLPKGWIGEGPDIPHMKHVSRWADLTPGFMSAIAEKYDFFINTSISDANPTTILEAMAWGFPVACTPQSGYHNMPSVTTLSTADIAKNIEDLLELQYMQEEKLLEISAINRSLVETNYTWERFCNSIWKEIKVFS